MRLDCIEKQDGEWAVINLDDDAKTLATGVTIDDAWHMAAIELARLINEMESFLRGIGSER